MKKCSFCAEEIQDEAIKCKHCGEMLQEKKPALPWYFRKSTIIILFLCVGPLALPLVWFHPKMSQRGKWAVTIAVLVLSYYLGVAFVGALRSVKEYYGALFEGVL